MKEFLRKWIGSSRINRIRRIAKRDFRGAGKDCNYAILVLSPGAVEPSGGLINGLVDEFDDCHVIRS